MPQVSTEVDMAAVFHTHIYFSCWFMIKRINKRTLSMFAMPQHHLMKQFLSLSSPADALTAVLTKINRLDIVTLLEGPIFDYGNISGTRCFADDNAVFPDQSDGKV